MAAGRNNADQSALAMFAAELRAARAKAGMSRDELGVLANYSGSLVALVENMTRVPTLAFAQRLDEALGTPGTFERMQEHLRAAPFPSWFRPWAEIEVTATQLRLFEHSLVPGLLQTEDYARAMLSLRPNTSENELDALVAARMERQTILYRDIPPMVWAVIGEAVLGCQVGSAKVMHDQLPHLADMSSRGNLDVQVVPLSAGGHYALLGAFAVAEADGMARAAYLETVTEGYIVETPALLSEVCLAWDRLRSQALPSGASKDLIMKWAGTYEGRE
jgi:transcriptional regulator with XRE-family HTH domain